MDTSFYRAPDGDQPEVRRQRSIALSHEEQMAVSVLQGRWEQETASRITFADVVRACIWRMFRAHYPEDTVLQGAPPPEPPIRTVRLTDCHKCGESFPAEDLSSGGLCAVCWRRFHGLPEDSAALPPARKGAQDGK